MPILRATKPIPDNWTPPADGPTHPRWTDPDYWRRVTRRCQWDRDGEDDA